MNEQLSVYNVTLRTLSPVFVGSGSVYTKKEYSYIPRQGIIRFVNQEKLMQKIVDDGKIDEYEAYMTSPSAQGLTDFFNMCGWGSDVIQSLKSYDIHEGDALHTGEPLSEIHAFSRDSAGRAYIPGSSLKGALRTVLLVDMMRSAPPANVQSPSASSLETKYLHRLNFDQEKFDSPLNSIMRGIRISDSAVIPDSAMTLCRKDDVNTHGFQHSINLARECLQPDTFVRFTMTLDHSLLHGVDISAIRKAFANFPEYYRNEYLRYFSKPANAQPVPAGEFFFLGGGSGYFSKNLIYPAMGHERAAQYTANYMQCTFRKHGHDRDVSEHKISPHCLKYTHYNAINYQFGMCKVEFK